MADDSIAVVDLDRCQPDRCNYECANYCPPNRTGKECITKRGEDAAEGDPDQIHISEEICLGETCDLRREMPVRRDRDHQPPSELDEEPVHRYGDNAFSLYGLPTPKPGNVTGILGPNGIGKSTAVHALAGEMVPNLGDYESEGDWERVLDRFRGTGLQNYLQSLKEGDVTVARKPQYVDQIPNQFDGNTRELLEHRRARGALDSPSTGSTSGR